MRSLHLNACRVEAFDFFSVENERTDGGVRTNVGALVALDAVLRSPCRNECGHTALLVCGGALRPGAVLDSLEGGNFQQVAVLCVDGAYHFVDECGIVVGLCRLRFERSPCRVDGQLLVFAAAVNGCIVLVHHVLSLLAVRLHDELLHLFYGQIHGDDTCDAEEGRLQDGVGAVAQADFLCDLRGVDIVNLDVVLGKVSLHAVRQVLGQRKKVPFFFKPRVTSYMCR